MKPEEMMLGDWISFNGEPVKVQQVVSGINELDYEPIPLTAEILQKNGFIKDEDRGKDFGQTYHILIPTGYEAHSFTVQVTIYKEPIQGVDVLFKCWGWIPPFNGGLDDIHLCSLKYVHQIQHALRLCGIDKEIVL